MCATLCSQCGATVSQIFRNRLHGFICKLKTASTSTSNFPLWILKLSPLTSGTICRADAYISDAHHEPSQAYTTNTQNWYTLHTSFCQCPWSKLPSEPMPHPTDSTPAFRTPSLTTPTLAPSRLWKNHSLPMVRDRWTRKTTERKTQYPYGIRIPFNKKHTPSTISSATKPYILARSTRCRDLMCGDRRSGEKSYEECSCEGVGVWWFKGRNAFPRSIRPWPCHVGLLCIPELWTTCAFTFLVASVCSTWALVMSLESVFNRFRGRRY